MIEIEKGKGSGTDGSPSSDFVWRGVSWLCWSKHHEDCGKGLDGEDISGSLKCLCACHIKKDG